MQGFRLLHNELLEGGESRHPEHRWPVDTREFAHQLVVRILVVVGIDITQLHLVVAHLSDTLLDGIHLLHQLIGLRLVIAQSGEQAPAVSLIGLAHRQCLRVFVEVVVAVAQSESTLRDIDDIVIGIAEVGIHAPGIHHRALTATVNLGGHTLILLAVLHGTNLLDVGHDRCQPLLVTLQRVHHLVVERTDLIPQRTLLLWLGREFQNHLLNLLLVLLVEVEEGTVGHLVVAQRMRLEPVAAGIFHEVVTRFHVKVHVRLVVTIQLLCRGCCSANQHQREAEDLDCCIHIILIKK